MPVIDTDFTEKTQEGTIKQFGPNDTRRLDIGSSGLRRWLSTRQKESAGNPPGASEEPAEAGEIPPVGDFEEEQLAILLKDNPFIIAVTLKDIDDIWIEKMQEIKGDKRYTQDLLDKNNHRLEFTPEGPVKKALQQTKSELETIIKETTRERKLNLQRVAYEMFRLSDILSEINTFEPTFNFDEVENMTMDEIEQKLKEVKNV